MTSGRDPDDLEKYVMIQKDRALKQPGSKTYRSDEVLAGAPEKRSEPSGSRFDVSGSRPRAVHGPRVIRSRSGQR